MKEARAKHGERRHLILQRTVEFDLFERRTGLSLLFTSAVVSVASTEQQLIKSIQTNQGSH